MNSLINILIWKYHVLKPTSIHLSSSEKDERQSQKKKKQQINEQKIPQNPIATINNNENCKISAKGLLIFITRFSWFCKGPKRLVLKRWKYKSFPWFMTMS